MRCHDLLCKVALVVLIRRTTAVAVEGDVDFSNQTIASNETDNLGLQPWPNVPFTIPNGESENGNLRWESLSVRGGIRQRAAFSHLVDSITALPGRINLPTLQGLIEFPDDKATNSLFFDISLHNRRDPSKMVRSFNIENMLKTVIEQVNRYGLREMQVDLVDHPSLEGSMQLVIADDPRDIPSSVPTFLYVQTAYHNFVIEIHKSAPTKANHPPTHVLEQTSRVIVQQGTDRTFITTTTFLEGWLVGIEPKKDRGQPRFTNGIALKLIDYLTAYENRWRYDIYFNIWASRGGGSSIQIGDGSILYRVETSSTANVTVSGQISANDLVNNNKLPNDTSVIFS